MLTLGPFVNKVKDKPESFFENQYFSAGSALSYSGFVVVETAPGTPFCWWQT